ncbi:MAG: YciI family protein [Crocinitomicaceae bacterium]
MKSFSLLLFLFLGFLPLTHSQSEVYDSTLAKKLGADDYGMKMYVMVVLKTGDSTVENTQLRDSLFSGHMKNIHQMAEDGKLIVAGPFGKNDQEYRGIFILDVATIEDARDLMKGDPAIQGDLLKAQYLLWYGSAALPLYLEHHQKIEKTKP